MAWDGTDKRRSMKLPPDPIPTNQRAELMGIVMALRWAAERCKEEYPDTRINVRIRSDSEYASKCMTEEIYALSASVDNVANGDLIQEASDLHGRIIANGSVVEPIIIPRDENKLAARICQSKLEDIHLALISNLTSLVNDPKDSMFN
ncbi:hypothetical protein RRF57_003580 [Xylaria bambusicola]|uniref:RNase H type-1 domain-containing protein n=1 Tax=Xylaria bambusicola TaxID=326684 RepID=A0AAN7U954_9PEZI